MDIDEAIVNNSLGDSDGGVIGILIKDIEELSSQQRLVPLKGQKTVRHEYIHSFQKLIMIKCYQLFFMLNFVRTDSRTPGNIGSHGRTVLYIPTVGPAGLIASFSAALLR